MNYEAAIVEATEFLSQGTTSDEKMTVAALTGSNGNSSKDYCPR